MILVIQLITNSLHSKKNLDLISRLTLPELFTRDFLVEKNQNMFPSLASTIRSERIKQSEELVQKIQSVIHLGYQRYELHGNINGSK